MERKDFVIYAVEEKKNEEVPERRSSCIAKLQRFTFLFKSQMGKKEVKMGKFKKEHELTANRVCGKMEL